ncbi:hemolysin [Patiriisocius marinus]|uniref:Hemolysin n=1 Tax=Patiriisocius marinus TaxID=1397112 RepID=A0A5J4J0L0_9FLAO|nr:HlyD family efflux transporter periplasmic adaptor subunit [Patiriisocius marinus]GER59488.1 hemolysin [Patiriisocius marinus]
MERENEEFYVYSEGVQDILSNPPKSIFKWGNTILFGFIILLITISFFIKYPDVIIAQSIVTSQNPPILLSPKINDKIDSLFFKDNSSINENDWIAIIDNNVNLSHIKLLDSILKNIERVEYDIDSVLEIEFTKLNLGEIQSNYNNLARLAHSYEHHLEDGNYEKQANLQDNQLQVFNNLIKSAENDRDVAKRELELSEINLNRNKQLFNKGVISKREFETYETQYLQSQRSYESQIARIFQLKSQKININSNKSNLGHSEEETILSNELNIYEAVKETEIALDNWIKTHVIKSPVNGKLKYLQTVNLNQFVQPNIPLFSVIPNEEGDFIGYLKIPVLNSGKVEIGQIVNISLDGFNASEFGLLKAHITNLSNVPNDNFFQANIKLSNGLTTTHGKKIEYLKNLSGSAQIITEDLRLVERFFHQIREVLSRD